MTCLVYVNVLLYSLSTFYIYTYYIVHSTILPDEQLVGIENEKVADQSLINNITSVHDVYSIITEEVKNDNVTQIEAKSGQGKGLAQCTDWHRVH